MKFYKIKRHFFQFKKLKFKKLTFLGVIFIIYLIIFFKISNIDTAGLNEKSLQPNHLNELSVADNKVIQFSYQYQRKRSSIYATTSDYRAHVLREYFKKYNSPLVDFAQEFVNACNKYQAPKDCTTLAAIAYVETKLCTLGFAAQQKNCWGFGGSGHNRITFNTYNEAIDYITKTLVSGYGNYYLQNPRLMQYTYCGITCNKWGSGVQSARIEINRISENLGYPKLL